jgi:branched-chain amino acid transport system permease protein
MTDPFKQAATTRLRATLTGRHITVAATLTTIAVAFGAILFLGRDYIRFIAALMMINAIAAMGVNIAMGFTGLVSIGHAGFGAISAYATTLMMVHWDVPYLIALPAGALVSVVLGVAIGLPALRLSPLYIAMVTFGFGQAVQYLAINWIDLTRGPNGMTVPPITFFGVDATSESLTLVTGLTCAALFWVSWNIRRTRLGRAFMAIRESATAAQSAGVPLSRYKTIAFGISAFYGGIAGGLYAAISGFVNPDAFTFGVSMSYVAMSVIGGIGTLIGPLIGACILTLLPEFLRSFAEYKEVLTGIALLAFLVLMPGGLVGVMRRWMAHARGTGGAL